MEIQNRNTNIEFDGKDIIFANGKYYIAHCNPNGVASSEDLSNWKDIPIDSTKLKCVSLAYGNNIFLMTGYAGTTNDTYICVSDDGENWELKKLQSDVSFSMNCNTCKFLNNMFVFTTGYRYSDINDNTKAVVIEINTTKDGINFNKIKKRIDTNKNYYIMDITFGLGMYIMVGFDGLILTSRDLVNWEQVNSHVNEQLVGITYGKDKFIVTGANGIILTSSDGINWEKQDSGTNSYLIRSRYGNGLYVAVGYNGTLLSSINGTIWDKIETGTKSMIYGLLYYNNNYVFSAEKGYIGIAITTRELSISDEECIYVYNNNLEFLGIIEDFISLRWRRKFFEAGEFEIVVPPNENNIKLLQKENILIRNNYTEAGIIDTIHYNDDGENIEITCSGKFLSYILHRRIIKKSVNFSGPTIDGMKILLNNMSPFPNFEIENTSLSTQNIQFQCTYKNVYDYLVKLSKYCNVGFRIVPNVENKTYIFENYIGIDRSINQNINERYFFSDDMNNIENSEYLTTSKNEYNCALVGGKGEGTSRTLVEVVKGNPTGFALREIFVDAKNQDDNNLSQEQYTELLKELGTESLTNETDNFETSVFSNDYKIKWDLGDIVNVKKDDWKIGKILRIIEVEETKEDGKQNVIPVFGNPLPEPFEKEE